jgi:hypothetical protein
MPSSVSLARRRKAFDEGRRAATDNFAKNPYANPALKKLWEEGLRQQKGGLLTTPVPQLKHGARRAATPQPRGPRPPSRGATGRGPFGPRSSGGGGNFRRPGDGPPPRYRDRPR